MSEIWSKMYIGLLVKDLVLLSDFNETWIFFTDFQKILRNLNFMKIRSVRAELFHVDRQTDMTKLIAMFYNFANAPKNHCHE